MLKPSYSGPLAGLQVVTDRFGPIWVLAPRLTVLSGLRLKPAPFEHGLTLLDPQENQAVVCRVWRQRLIGDLEFADRIPRIEGACMLVRSDIVEAISARAANPIRYLSLVTRADPSLTDERQ
jgi:hypothetical protein